MCSRRFPILLDSGLGRHHTCSSVSFSRQRSILGRYSSTKSRRASSMKDCETPAVVNSACGVVMAKTYRHSTASVNVSTRSRFFSCFDDQCADRGYEITQIPPTEALHKKSQRGFSSGSSKQNQNWER